MIFRALDRLSDWISNLTIVAASVMAVAMISSLCLEVFYRFVLRHSLFWSEELALLFFTWIVLLLGSVGVREGFHVRVSLFTDMLPSRTRLALERLIMTGLFLFGLAMVYAGWGIVLRNWDQVAPATRYPLPLLYAAVPAMGALIALHAFARLINPQISEPGAKIHE